MKEKTSYTFYPGTARIPEGNAPDTVNRSYTITAEVEIHTNEAEGPICAIGGVSNGWSLYVKDRRLIYCYNGLGKHIYIRSTKELPTGKKVKLRYQFEKTGQEKFGAGGIGKLFIDGDKVAEGQIPQTVKFRYTIDESFDIGRDTASPVSEEYKAGAQFTGGTIEKVVIDLVGEKHIDHEAETKVAMKRQ
jgi:arylsulfatase